MLEHDILTSDRSIVYDLYPTQSVNALMVGIPTEVAEQLTQNLTSEKDGRINLLIKTLNWKLSSFIPPSEDEWGFGKTFAWEDPQTLDQVLLSCTLPDISSPTPENWQRMHDTSASLNLLFRFFNLASRKQDDSQKQLLHIMLEHATINAVLSTRLMPFLASFPQDTKHLEIEQTMYQAYLQMARAEDKRHYLRYYFSVQTRQSPRGLYLKCPGISDCSLNAGYYRSSRPDIGYLLEPHNVDNCLQQFTFLVGLAKLNQQAKEVGF